MQQITYFYLGMTAEDFVVQKIKQQRRQGDKNGTLQAVQRKARFRRAAFFDGNPKFGGKFCLIERSICLILAVCALKSAPERISARVTERRSRSVS